MERWQKELSRSVTTFDELKKHVRLSPGEKKYFMSKNIPDRFRITPHVLRLIDPRDFQCPIRLQFIPSADEMCVRPGELSDPLGDRRFTPVNGVVHKYRNRCLVLPTMRCPAYCRFCFRKELINENSFDANAVLAYLRKHTELREVIFSGGDPLFLGDRALSSLLKSIAKIPHIRVIRIHTRVPVVLPSRITQSLANLFKKSPVQIIVVVHVNHPKEISREFIRAVKILRLSGVMILSQSVLLRGVNDTISVLEKLFTGLVESGVKPYYLHQLDPVCGTSHFFVSPVRGKLLMRRLRGKLAGVCIPHYVVDSNKKSGKVFLPLS